MKLSGKAFIVTTLTITAVLFISGILVRYVIDPVGINKKFDIGLIKDYGIAHRTQKYVELGEFKPDTLMIGGSRVHYMQPKDVNKYTGDRVYNLGLSYSTMEEQYYFLKYAAENLKIKNVVLGLNLYPFSEVLNESNGTDFDREVFEKGFTFDKKIKHYLEISLFKYLKYAYFNEYTSDFYRDGAITPYGQTIASGKSWEDRYKNSYNGYIKKYTNYLEYGDTNIEYLRKMVDICKKHNINLNVFMAAIHSDQINILNKINKMDFNYKLKKEIAKITPYWDFLYDNSVTSVNDNFIDTSHIKNEFGPYYFARIFNDKNFKHIDDFGIYINSDNVDNHIEFLKKNSEDLNDRIK